MRAAKPLSPRFTNAVSAHFAAASEASAAPSAEAAARKFFRPVRALQSFVRFGLVLSDYGPHGAAALERIPNARATIYFASGVRLESGQTIEHGIFCEGPHATKFEVTASCTRMLGFKVKSGALRALLGVSASEVSGRTLDLRDLWGRGAARLADRVALSAPAESARVLERALLDRIEERPDDRAIIALVDLVERTDGRIAVAELAERFGCSRRTLVQKFHDSVGLPPKVCSRLSRMRALLAQIGSTRAPIDWAELAIHAGYYDQAHMSHEFRDLLGAPPAALARDLSAFSPSAGLAEGRHSLPRREQHLYRLLGMVSGWAQSRPNGHRTRR